MSRVALIGASESSLPVGSGGGAAIMRTRRFLLAMSEAGHDVALVTPDGGYRAGEQVARELRNSGPFDAVVAISMDPAVAAVRSVTALPMWIDLN